MHHRPLRRAIALSVVALVAFAGTAAADTARADGDVATSTIEVVADLGAVAPGEVVSVDIGLVLTCTGSAHVDPGQTVTAGIDSANAPLDGAILSVTDATVGPAPADWPLDDTSCPIPAPTFTGGTPSVVTLRAPTTPGDDHRYSLMYHRSFSPFGVNDAEAIRQLTAIDIVLDVVANTPPTLILPNLAGVGTAEGDMTGGWAADWTGLGATDVEDDPDPLALCVPGAGTVLPLGTTSVTCSVTDAGDLTTTATFDLTVTDTTPPALADVPDDGSMTTGDPTGTTLAYATPGATDLVDADPTVACLPASGSHFGLGTTTVTCTATDDTGNTAHASFDVTVDYVPTHVASASWGEPVAGSGSVFSANRGRTIPVKVQLLVDGVARSTGKAHLTVTPCNGGSALTMELAQGAGRWNTSIDTASLPGPCHTVAAWIDGLEAGSFRLELRGTEPARTGKRR
jgi:hypothetical protein